MLFVGGTLLTSVLELAAGWILKKVDVYKRQEPVPAGLRVYGAVERIPRQPYHRCV